MPAFLRARDIDVTELLAEAGLPLQALSEKELAIAFSATALMFDLVARRLNDPIFGLSYARAFPPAGTGLLGQVVLSAPTVRDSLKALKAYLHINISHVDVQFNEGDGIAKFEFTWPASLSVPQTQIISFYMASLILRLREATGSAWLPLAVEFQHREPEALDAYQAFFGTRLSFERKSNAIVVDATSLAKRMPVIYDGLHASLLELSAHKLKEQQVATTVAAQVRDLMAARLSHEMPFDLEAVSSELQISTRALQWRLEQEETSYEKVLLVTRMAEAEKYLRDSSYQLTRIAALLGFSELSAFTRWSQKHFLMTPSAMRQHLRVGGSAPGSTGDDTP
jgi:AraC-like DNA-binding protein